MERVRRVKAVEKSLPRDADQLLPNIDLAEGLMPALHAVEAALRNRVHTILRNQRGTDMWFQLSGLLDAWHASEFKKTRARAAKSRR